MVYAWYPTSQAGGAARSGTAMSSYFPHLEVIARVLGDSLTNGEFGAALPEMRSGRVRSYVSDGAPLSAAAATYPVLLFSPGFGESGLTYAAQLTDLASHGFVVFAIEHPYDAFAAWFPDGRVVPFAAAAWDSAQHRQTNGAVGVPSGAVQYQLAQISIRADDIRFVLDQIGRLNAAASRTNLFAHHLDMSRVGVFGHSLGGAAAGNACRVDARIRACGNEDVDDDGRPYMGGTAAPSIKQPFLFFATGHSIYVSRRTPQPSGEALEHMKLTRAQYDSIVQLYQHNQDAALAAMPGGAIRIMAESDAFTHRTFIDLKLLQANNDSAAATQRHYIDLIRAYVLAFFDETLNGRTDSAFARTEPLDSIITVQRFGSLAR
jgi:predicted dienelactone hydrolase